jgi:hypothetical protein
LHVSLTPFKSSSKCVIAHFKVSCCIRNVLKLIIVHSYNSLFHSRIHFGHSCTSFSWHGCGRAMLMGSGGWGDGRLAISAVWPSRVLSGQELFPHITFNHLYEGMGAGFGVRLLHTGSNTCTLQGKHAQGLFRQFIRLHVRDIPPRTTLAGALIRLFSSTLVMSDPSRIRMRVVGRGFRGQRVEHAKFSGCVSSALALPLQSTI